MTKIEKSESFNPDNPTNLQMSPAQYRLGTSDRWYWMVAIYSGCGAAPRYAVHFDYSSLISRGAGIIA